MVPLGVVFGIGDFMFESAIIFGVGDDSVNIIVVVCLVGVALVVVFLVLVILWLNLLLFVVWLMRVLIISSCLSMLFLQLWVCYRSCDADSVSSYDRDNRRPVWLNSWSRGCCIGCCFWY